MKREFTTEAPLSIREAWLCPKGADPNDGAFILEANDESRVIVPRKLIPAFREFVVKVEKEARR